MSQDQKPRVLTYLRPLWLLDTAFAYVFGAAIVRYLGFQLDWSRFLWGGAWLLSWQLGGHCLDLYFAQLVSSKTNNLNHSKSLWASTAALSTTAVLTILFIRADIINSGSLIIMILLIGGMLAITVPPLRLSESVYRELTLSVLGVVFVPALAFILQANQLHRFVAMSVFPLALLHTAALIIFKFPNFAVDKKYEKQSLLVRVGWQRGMIIVNILILSAFLLLGLALLAGLSPTIVLPAFFVFPLALFQIWYLNRIAAGAKPYWKALSWSGVSVYALTAYLLLFGFLTN